MKLLFVVVCVLFFVGSIVEATEWELRERADGETPVSINVFLHQNQAGVKELESLLLEELANPLSPRYGQWLDSFQVMAYTAPPEEQQLRAARWMESTGMSCRLYGDFAVLSGTVAQAEQLFQVRFWVLAHPRLSYTMVRCLDEPTLPAEMRDIIHMVPSFGRLFEPQQRYAKRPAAAAGQTDSVNYGVVPQTVRQLYNIPESAQCLSSKSSLAVVEFGNSAGISFTDLTTFQKQTSSTRSNVTSIVGNFQPFNPANGDDGESTLDVQYALAVAANLTVHGGSFGFWVVQGWIEDFTTLVQQRQQDGQFVPWIFSISYGWAELQACRVAGLGLNCVAKNESEPYVVRTNTELMKIGSTGVTIIGLSQDAGAASKWNMACDKTPEVNPSWPGASPYITTLGATQVLNGQILPGSSTSPICSQLTCLDGTTGTEVVCSVATGALITSGGGFSIYAPALPYQSTAVAGFLKGPGLRPPASMFNPANRGEADIALIGHALQVVLDGQWLAVDGTSASAPIFAGMATLLNDIRFQNNRAPLGFLNPLLYTLWAQTPSAYHDITIGNNTATEYPNTCTTPGYGAVPGWDPPTGLGCPLYSQFASYVSSLP